MRRLTNKVALAAAATTLAIAVAGSVSSGKVTGRTASAAEAAPSIPLDGSWSVDPAHTNVNFAVRHMGISQVRGRFNEVAGTIVADRMKPENSSVQFTIQTTSIDTNVKMRDDDLRSEKYFDVAKYPTITFQSTRITKKKGDVYEVTGNIMMHNVTKLITLTCHVHGPIKDPFGGVRFGLETETHLNRRDFGVGGGDTLANGDFAIGNDIDVVISLEAVPPKPAATT